MALAPIHIVGSARCLNKPTALTHLMMLGVSLVLTLIGFHFLSSLNARHVSWLDAIF